MKTRPESVSITLTNSKKSSDLSLKSEILKFIEVMKVSESTLRRTQHVPRFKAYV